MLPDQSLNQTKIIIRTQVGIQNFSKRDSYLTKADKSRLNYPRVHWHIKCWSPAATMNSCLWLIDGGHQTEKCDFSYNPQIDVLAKVQAWQKMKERRLRQLSQLS